MSFMEGEDSIIVMPEGNKMGKKLVQRYYKGKKQSK